MARAIGNTYVAEWCWSGVGEDDLRELDRRIEGPVAEVAERGEPIEYLGSMLIVDDDVVLCLVEGPIATVRQVTKRAAIAFGRISAQHPCPWTQRSGGADT